MAALRSFLVNVAYVLSLFREFWSDMRAQKRRTVLTIFGIVWGTAAVVIMMAVGTSVKRQNMTNFRGLGDAIILVFPGSTTKPYRGFGVDREISGSPRSTRSARNSRNTTACSAMARR
jgi:hypothetical protein